MNAFMAIKEQRMKVHQIYGKELKLTEMIEARAYFGGREGTKNEAKLLDVLLMQKVALLSKRFDLSLADTGLIFLGIAEVGASRSQLLDSTIALAGLVKENSTFARVMLSLNELVNNADFIGYSRNEPMESFIGAVALLHTQQHFNKVDFDDFLHSIRKVLNSHTISKDYKSGLELVEQISEEILIKYAKKQDFAAEKRKKSQTSKVDAMLMELEETWKKGAIKEYIEMVPAVAKLLYSELRK
ncbi:MAG: hypothetical protein KGH61_05260 [Candidatus Micrarchaeota archaeon]|nr:hypothetical protein [Candidatus Micrarchaeota archaeon]MDE1848323.1 hypothetical protein [Candidatus Micrarchaeota archaeon]MDE1864912.1 hypothetical protein [Candidatus Micrarchaeota archaeon]